MSATSIAYSYGLSERVVGLTIVSIGTSLPELATSLVAAKKRNVDIAIGNVVGSNIFNIFFILGVSAIVNPFEVNLNSFLDIAVNIVASLLLFVFVLSGKRRQLERWHGFVLVAAYIVYMVIIIRP